MMHEWTVIGVVFVVACATVLFGLVGIARYLFNVMSRASQLIEKINEFEKTGLDELIGKKLATFEAEVKRELEAREKLLRAAHEEITEEERKAREAAERFHEAIGAVQKEIEALRDLKPSVSELTDLLKPQQLRGELGEVIVRALIQDKLAGDQYVENFTFSDGKQVEFVIRLNTRLIPVDSKLPLDDFKRMREATDERQRHLYRNEFKRTLKREIDKVKEYIRPEEGTFNFAIMVIPSEAVFYEVIAGKEFREGDGIYQYAISQQVFLTSPNTFWANLTAIQQGLRGVEIERHAEQILAYLQTLANDIRNFSKDEFEVLGKHLKDAWSKFTDAERILRNIQDDLAKLERLEQRPAMTSGGVS